jgi:hypothetical protein
MSIAINVLFKSILKRHLLYSNVLGNHRGNERVLKESVVETFSNLEVFRRILDAFV